MRVLRAKREAFIKAASKKDSGSENLKIIWLFDNVDKDGIFAFDINRPDFDHKEFLDKLLSYSNMTWGEIRKQTHDSGKSKHHFLEDVCKFSKEARERVKAKKLENDSDSIFSFALNNKVRIIGIRQREFFHVIWYDKNHEFYPSAK